MKKLTIIIECGGASFDPDRPHDQVAKILRDLAKTIENGGTPAKLLDSNMCRAGSVVYG